MRKIILLTLLLAGCNSAGIVELTRPAAPEIILDSRTSSYAVKRGRQVVIRPEYRYVDDASYAWSIDGRVVGREPSYTFVGDDAGEVWLQIEVTTPNGSAREEIRIDVMELAIPYVTLPGAAEGFNVLAGTQLRLAPEVADTRLETLYEWSVDGSKACDSREYTFDAAERGSYRIAFRASNEDGEDGVEFTVTVASADEVQFSWTFVRTDYNMSAGRTLRLQPRDIRNAFDAEYVWTVDGREAARSSQPAYDFTSTDEGRHDIAVTMTNSYFTVTRQLTVTVCPAEGRYYRPRNGSSQSRCNRVYEFTPAPGQFINDGYTVSTRGGACSYAEERLQSKAYVSLGAFGGYIVVGFDHSIDNTGDYDFAIAGNSFDTSSEPGIVWVMQDENGNGLPDDTWYELAGSETGKASTIQDYAVTYYRPSGRANIPWTDNRGGSGTVDINNFHRQDYWPAWVDGDSYTLRGTCLEARNYDSSGNGSSWVQPAYGWGYADNFSSEDRLTDSGNATAGANPNHFKISNAIDESGRSVSLKYIDFIKVQTGVCAKSGWLGELSTEVLDFYDYSMSKE